MSNLQQLYLTNTPLTNADLEEISVLDNLKYLGISGTHVTDEGLANLKEMEDLTWLDLDSSQLTDEGLKHVKAVLQLRSLWFHGTGPCKHSIRELPQLTIIGFYNTSCIAFEPLTLPNVRQLHFRNVSTEGVSDALTQVDKLTSLKHLLFFDSSLTDPLAIDYLENLEQLERLHLQNTGISTTVQKRLQKALPTCRITN